MSRKKQVRIALRTPLENIQLIKVHEQSSGDLTLTQHWNHYYERGFNNFGNLGPAKYSVHVSDRARKKGHTITYEAVKDGIKDRSNTFFYQEKDYFVAPLFSTRLASVYGSTRSLRPKRGDKIHFLGGYDPYREGVILHVFATDRIGGDLLLKKFSSTSYGIVFRRFSIVVVGFKFWAIDWNQGDTARLNYSFGINSRTPLIAPDGPALGIEDSANLVESNTNMLLEKFRHRIFEAMDRGFHPNTILHRLEVRRVGANLRGLNQ